MIGEGRAIQIVAAAEDLGEKSCRVLAGHEVVQVRRRQACAAEINLVHRLVVLDDGDVGDGAAGEEAAEIVVGEPEADIFDEGVRVALVGEPIDRRL
jgi:hypothetical protein